MQINQKYLENTAVSYELYTGTILLLLLEVLWSDCECWLCSILTKTNVTLGKEFKIPVPKRWKILPATYTFAVIK